MIENNFSNQNIQPPQLPEITALDMQSLSARYAPINRLLHLALTLLMCVVGMAVYLQPFIPLSKELFTIFPYLIWATGLLGFLITSYRYMSNNHKFYALRELDLHFSSGLLFRKIVSQPVTRIQHMELKRGPIERKVGLATLQVFSAGGEMHTFEIPGLPVEKAEQLRQFVLQHKELAKHG